MKNKYNDYSTGIPQHEIEALCRTLLPDMQAFFATEEGRREYAEWKASQVREKESKKQEHE